ncbi:MAG: hypothetical protein O3A85_08105 [Proteobacteria bacterium]|nr:hypothetical protein [Pseudomonadota bacterium]
MLKKTVTAIGVAALAGVGAMSVLPEAVAKSATTQEIIELAQSKPCNPCAAQKKGGNPCNPCAAKKAGGNPCNPCAAKKADGNPCNPCAAKKKTKM